MTDRKKYSAVRVRINTIIGNFKLNKTTLSFSYQKSSWSLFWKELGCKVYIITHNPNCIKFTI